MTTLQRERRNCVPCLMGPLLDMGSVCGITCVRRQCPHSGRAPYGRFEKSLKLQLVSTVLLLPVLAGVVCICADVLKARTDIKVFELLIELIFATGAIFMCISGVWKTEVRLQEFNGLCAIVESRRDYDIESFLTLDQLRRYTLLVYGIVSVSVFLIVVSILYSFQQNNDNPYIVAIRTTSLFITTLMRSVAILHSIFSVSLYRSFYDACFSKAEDVLKERATVKTPGLAAKLRKLNRLYMSLTQNYERFLGFINPAMTTWWVGLIVVLIFSFDILALLYVTDHRDLLLEVRSYSSVIGILIYTARAEKLNTLSEEILAFLHKYPVSKLNAAEATQVEMFISTLNNQKPVLRASDLFTVGTKLLASIFGTIVTYVLVSLQFHVRRAK